MDYAVVGTGYWGQNHVRVAAELQEEDQLDSVVLCDIDEKRVSDLASNYGFEYVTEHERLPERGVDAVVVATPSPTHHGIATDLLANGVDVLVEKPLSLDTESAYDIVTTADRHDRVLAVGHIFRHHPALTELKSRIDRGELGGIKYLHTGRFSFRAPRATAGTLFSLAVHDIDIYNYLLDGEPDQLYCQLDSFIREDVDETATLLLEYGETTGVINSSWQVPVFGKRRDITVVGTERAAYIDYLQENKLELFETQVVSERTNPDEDTVYRAVDNGSTRIEVENREPLKVEVEDFLTSCRNRTEPKANGTVGADAVSLLNAAQRSAAEEAVLTLNEHDR
jgi:predicted dehydrogenase